MTRLAKQLWLVFFFVFFPPSLTHSTLDPQWGWVGGPRVPPPRGGQERGQTSTGVVRVGGQGEEEELDRRTDIWIDGQRKKEERKSCLCLTAAV